jgi:hypothetical protein
MTQKIPFLRYAFKGVGGKGLLAVSGLLLLFIAIWAITQEDWLYDALLVMLTLLPIWLCFWWLSWKAYKRYTSIPENYKHNTYE